MYKQCTKCAETKELLCFNKDKRGKLGLRASCKDCEKLFKQQHSERYRNYRKIYEEKSKEKISERNKKYYKENKSRINAREKERRLKNIDHAKKVSKQYYTNNKEKISQYQKEYKQKNKEKLAAYQKEYLRKRELEDISFALKRRLAKRMGKALNRGNYKRSRSVIEALGCTSEEFCKHIEKQFLQGMTWENRDKWHLDHIIPISTAKNEEEIYALSHFTNIRPMWARENISKRDKITHLI